MFAALHPKHSPCQLDGYSYAVAPVGMIVSRAQWVEGISCRTGQKSHGSVAASWNWLKDIEGKGLFFQETHSFRRETHGVYKRFSLKPDETA